MKFASTRSDGYKNKLTFHYDCPGWGENDRRLFKRRMQTSCATTFTLEEIEEIYLIGLGQGELLPLGRGCLYDETCTSGECGIKEWKWHDQPFGPILSGFCVCRKDDHCPTGSICADFQCWSNDREVGEECNIYGYQEWKYENVKFHYAAPELCSSNRCRQGAYTDAEAYEKNGSYDLQINGDFTCLCNVDAHCPYDSPTCDRSSGTCSTGLLDVCDKATDLSSCDSPNHVCSKRVNEVDLKCRKRHGLSCGENQECSSFCCKNTFLGVLDKECVTEDRCHEDNFQFSHDCTYNSQCYHYDIGLVCKQPEGKCKRSNGSKCTGNGQCASGCCKGTFGRTCKNKSKC